MKRKMNIFGKKAVVVIAFTLLLVMLGSNVVASFDITSKISVNSYDNNELNNKLMFEPIEKQSVDNVKDTARILDLEEDVGSEIDDVEVPDIFDGEYSLCKQPVLGFGRRDSLSCVYKFSGLERKTIYVDDDFVDDPPNHKWDTIQEGIDDADYGDTVRVYD